MKLLAPKVRPIEHGCPAFGDQFGEYAKHADRICITTGYISTDSILFLKENIELGQLPNTDLTVGMYADDGLRQGQYNACRLLAETLETTGRGVARICTAFPFHGKVYSFWCNGEPFSAILGSSNLSSLTRDIMRQFEVDIAVEDRSILQAVTEIQQEVNSKATVRFLKWKPNIRPESRRILENIEDVKKLQESEVMTIKQRVKRTFELNLKGLPKCAKSNLNAHFGRGRLNTRTGLIRQRPWYEIGIIVSKEITNQPGYPWKREFDCVTDDGWGFKCKTSGDYSKNFRSAGALTVLGMWIKGRMQEAGVLQVCDKISQDHLDHYGRSTVTLSETDDPDLWFLDFAPPR